MAKLKKRKQKQTFQSFSLADQIAPMIIIEEEDYLKIGDSYETTVLAIDFPNDSEKQLGWLSEIFDIEGNVSVTLHMVPTGNTIAIENIDKAVKKTRGKLLNANNPESVQLSLKEDIKKYQSTIKNLITSSGNGFFSLGLSIKLVAPSKRELDKLKNRVKNKVVGTGITPYTPNGAMLDSFLTHLPFVNDKLFRYTAREIDSFAIASMFPFDSQDFGIKKGFAVGINPNSNQQINIDIRSLANHNMVLFGESGQGKSKTMWMLMCRVYMEGARVIIIDPENEYGVAIRRMGGTTINISNGTKDVINPLQVFGENTDNADDKGKEYEEPRDLFSIHLQNKMEFFKLLVPTSDELALAYVDDLLVELYKDFNIDSDTDFNKLEANDYPTLEDLYNKIQVSLDNKSNKKLDEFQIVLKKYVYGANKNIFNGHTNVDLNNDLICFNIKDLGEGTPMQTAAMSNTTQYIWDLITNNVKETYFFIDELHVLNNPKTPLTMELVRNIYKRIRKYGDSGAISASQQPSDVLNVAVNGVNYGSAVVENSQVTILLPMKPKSIQDLRDHASMSFSEEEVNVLSIREDKVGEGLLLYANKKAHVKFQLSSVEWEMLGATPKVA